MAHEAGALVFVDAVHYAPHRLVDVRAMGCDFLACSAYKFYGPHVGVLYGRHDLLRVARRSQAPARLRTPPRSGWRPAPRTTRGSSGAAAAVEFLASLAEGPDRRAGSRRPSMPCTSGARC